MLLWEVVNGQPGHHFSPPLVTQWNSSVLCSATRGTCSCIVGACLFQQGGTHRDAEP